MPRLFTSLVVPPESTKGIHALQVGMDGAVWERQPHITLAHFGDVDQAAVAPLITTLQQVRRRGTCTIEPTELDTFERSGKPNVLWLGVTPSAALSELAESLHEVRQRLGSEDPLRFVPHITIARVGEVEPEELASFMKAFDVSAVSSFEASSFTLYVSDTDGYTPVGEFDL